MEINGEICVTFDLLTLHSSVKPQPKLTVESQMIRWQSDHLNVTRQCIATMRTTCCQRKQKHGILCVYKVSCGGLEDTWSQTFCASVLWFFQWLMPIHSWWMNVGLMKISAINTGYFYCSETDGHKCATLSLAHTFGLSWNDFCQSLTCLPHFIRWNDSDEIEAGLFESVVGVFWTSVFVLQGHVPAMIVDCQNCQCSAIGMMRILWKISKCHHHACETRLHHNIIARLRQRPEKLIPKRINPDFIEIHEITGPHCNGGRTMRRKCGSI